MVKERKNLDLPWNDARSNKFITNVGLITSDGPFGADVMACEWTHPLFMSLSIAIIIYDHLLPSPHNSLS